MSENEMMRADVALTVRGLAASRERAQGLIAAGLVLLNGAPLKKCAARVAEGDELKVLGNDIPYVSRGGLKLEKALKRFDVSPKGWTCMDIGASTGGFTDVLLQNGAARVYAIDVGEGQLDPSLRQDPRVISMEHTNARTLNPEMFPQRPRLAVMDVSFISIGLILPAAFGVLGEEGRLLSLVKPQFECGPKALGKKGIVSDPRVHQDVLRRVAQFAESLGWRVQALDFSPIMGTAGNMEFLADFAPNRGQQPVSEAKIRALVRDAHRQLHKKEPSDGRL